MALADIVQEAQEPTNTIYNSSTKTQLETRLAALRDKVHDKLLSQGIRSEDISYEMYLNMRYQGTETSIMVLQPADGDGDFKAEFQKTHLREFAFVFPDEKPIFVDDIRVRGIGSSRQKESDGQQLGNELRERKSFTSAPRDSAERFVSRSPGLLPTHMAHRFHRRRCISRTWDRRVRRCFCCRSCPPALSCLDRLLSSTRLKRSSSRRGLRPRSSVPMLSSTSFRRRPSH